jgi:PAS domain S-box-containing protein
MKLPLNVLVIEDSKVDAELILYNLKKSGYDIHAERIETASELTISIQNHKWDIILADYRLPSFDAPSALEICREAGLDIPFIVISGTIGEELAIALMKSGAHDYLMKDNLTRLAAVVERELQEAQVRRDHKMAEKCLKESEEMYRTLLNASPEGIVILDTHGNISDVSNMALLILGYENKTEMMGKPFVQFIASEDKNIIDDLLKETAIVGLAQNVEILLNKKDAKEFNGEISITMIRDSEGKASRYMAIVRDISARITLEQQMIHTERMASLGEMATGIAHEINQPLNIITLSLENLLYEIDTKHTADSTYLKNKSNKIFENVTRIRNIIDHIRAFSRDHDMYMLTLFDMSESIMNAVSMVSEQFKHKGIELILTLDERIEPIVGNTNKFEQVILNLLLNSKDAIEERKKTQVHDIKHYIKIHTELHENRIVIEVSDNGIGIKAENLNKIMRPFFSTKDVGKGTGLGLSISFGIIKEMNGNIDVISKPNVGTKMRITIPVNQESFIKNSTKSVVSNQ